MESSIVTNIVNFFIISPSSKSFSSSLCSSWPDCQRSRPTIRPSISRRLHSETPWRPRSASELLALLPECERFASSLRYRIRARSCVWHDVSIRGQCALKRRPRHTGCMEVHVPCVLPPTCIYTRRRASNALCVWLGRGANGWCLVPVGLLHRNELHGYLMVNVILYTD